MRMGWRESLILLTLSAACLIAYALKHESIRAAITAGQESQLQQDIQDHQEPEESTVEPVESHQAKLEEPVVEITAGPAKIEEPKVEPKLEEIKAKPKDELSDLVDQMKERRVSGNGDRLQLEPRTLLMLVKLEQEWGEQLEIKWAKRDKALNTEIGGKSHSQHLKGKAVDIMHNGWGQAKMRKFIRLAYDIGFRGIGTGRTMIHIDTRDKFGAWLYPGSPYPSARTILRDKIK